MWIFYLTKWTFTYCRMCHENVVRSRRVMNHGVNVFLCEIEVTSGKVYHRTWQGSLKQSFCNVTILMKSQLSHFHKWENPSVTFPCINNIYLLNSLKINMYTFQLFNNFDSSIKSAIMLYSQTSISRSASGNC